MRPDYPRHQHAFSAATEHDTPDGSGNKAGPSSRFFVIALEESGDRLGAALVRALRQRSGGEIEVCGVGGRAMSEAGVNSLFPIEDLSVIGFGAIPKRLVTIVKRMRQTIRAIRQMRPDLLILIDGPTFNLPLARRARRVMAGLPIVSYASPPVWAWRFNRARTMRTRIDKVLALLPFEPVEYVKRDGPPCIYVGHPIIEELASLRPNGLDMRRRDAEPARVIVMAGSRTDEIARMLPLFGAAAAILAAHRPLEFVVPTFSHLRQQVEALTVSWAVRPRIVTDSGQKKEAMRGARAALAKSGTNTLELALARVPMVAAYRLSGLEAFVLRRLVRTPAFTLPNLLLGEIVVPELIHDNCTPQRLAAELLPLLSDTWQRRRQLDRFSRLEDIMQVANGSPAQRAADEILSLLRR